MAMLAKVTSREEWRKRIELWGDSGLSAEEFCAQHGINAGTLKYWKYRFGKDARSATGKPEPAKSARALPLVEVQAMMTSRELCFELEVGSGWRLRIPERFEIAALERLLNVLERRK